MPLMAQMCARCCVKLLDQHRLARALTNITTKLSTLGCRQDSIQPSVFHERLLARVRTCYKPRSQRRGRVLPRRFTTVPLGETIQRLAPVGVHCVGFGIVSDSRCSKPLDPHRLPTDRGLALRHWSVFGRECLRKSGPFAKTVTAAFSQKPSRW